MKNKTLTNIFLILAISASPVLKAEPENEADLTLCQDQAENYGDGKGGNQISFSCIKSFKQMAEPLAHIESKSSGMNFFGYRNMILIEKKEKTLVITEIIAGSGTELSTIRALAFDEKNQEIVALEESGDILFFSTKITGNIAPYRILKHKELVGSSEIVIDSVKNQVMVNNEKTKRVLYFSRLANINGPKGKEKLEIVKTIDSDKYDEFMRTSFRAKKP